MPDNPYSPPEASVTSTPATGDPQLAGWILFVIGCHVLGGALSGIASSYGVTEFPGDRRGEWAPVTIPILLLLSGVLGFTGYRRLIRSSGRARWRILAIAVSVTAASFCWITWRFANAGA